MALKHIPQRTCIACRTVRAKRELMRVVHTLDHHVQADATGKKAGRGAYVCRVRDCWETVLNTRGRLEHALNLESSISLEDLAQLREFAATLPPRDSANAAPINETK